MHTDWEEVSKNLAIVLSIALGLTFILVAGSFIGAASAHVTRVQHEYELTCIDKGGDMIYKPEVGKVCSKDR